MRLFLLHFITVGFVLLGGESVLGTESSLDMDFRSIKKVLRSDLLERSPAREKSLTPTKAIKGKKSKKISKLRRVKVAKKISPKSSIQYSYPDKEDFWSFFSALWLVKNVRKLKWDVKKIDYGLDVAFTKLLEQFGFFEKKFKILLLNDFSLTHMALPSNVGETIFLLSIPFMRTMDLTKREIAVLLLEDYIRFQMGYFINHVKGDNLNKFIGKTLQGKVDRTPLDEVLRRADDFIFKKGFNFQQQFEVTQRMTSLLRSNQQYWDAYLSLLNKIDKLIKSDQLYRSYTRIYPAPEIQLKWVLPEKKIL